MFWIPVWSGASDVEMSDCAQIKFVNTILPMSKLYQAPIQGYPILHKAQLFQQTIHSLHESSDFHKQLC